MSGNESAFHVTNGGSAALALHAAGMTGGILAWRDVLHDGPVPAGLSAEELAAVRATYIADHGWVDFAHALRDFRSRDRRLAASLARGEVVLWFEHDLYDQLQLIQAIDHVASLDPATARVTMTIEPDFLANLPPERIRLLFENRVPVAAAVRAVAVRAWAAFREPTPEALAALVASELPALPFLRAALVRLLEEYPAPASGLNRTERQLLEGVAAGADAPGSAFRASQAREEAMFMGDASFWLVVQRLLRAFRPLLAWEGAPPASFPATYIDDREFLHHRLKLTEAGNAALEGRLDHAAVNGVDRWIGGVRLTAGRVWRYDRTARRLLPPQ